MESFYYYFRPFAIIAKIIGLFPVENVSSVDTTRLNYRIFSFSILYSVGVFSAFMYLIYFFSEFIYCLNIHDYEFEYFMIYLIIGRGIICFMFCGFHSKKLLRIVRFLDTFDKRKINILVIPQTNNILRFFLWIVVPIAVLTIFIYVSIDTSSMLIKEILPTALREKESSIVVSYLFGFFSTWQIYPAFLYFYIALKLIYCFSEINQTMLTKEFVNNYFKENPKYDSDMYLLLSKIRMLHNMLSETVCDLGKCFGTFIAIHQLCVIVAFVINISIQIFKKAHGPHFFIVTFLYCVIVILIILVSDGIKTKGSEVVNLLHGIPSTAISEKTQQEINIFLTQLAVRPIEVSAAGYFVLDKSQTLAILSSVATYLIIIVQFLHEALVPCSSNATLSKEDGV